MRFLKLVTLVLFACAMPGLYGADETVPPGAAEKDLSPEEIIKKFTDKEAEFYKAWMNYTYVQNVYVRVLSVDGRPSNEWIELISEVFFNDDGSRDIRQISRRGELRAVRWTREDDEIINNLNPFALTTADLPLYDLKYEGKERVDELNCYVFAVKPKNIKRGRLYFEGKIWVDDVDFLVVRTLGKAVPQSKTNLFPEFETLRNMIDGKYWFPVWTHADERLRFPDYTVRIEQTVTYDDYRRFDAKTTIRYGTPGADDPE
ncbi:MAG: hypothetical protein LBJ21_04260 [Acidobacteriota bacterium]|jgi:hypothetical protein|nr:hypothetical protein [Acidobacteriota bacterium]